MKAIDIENELKGLADSEKAKQLSRFFKTGPGQYGEGDIFLGIKTPDQRKLIKICFKLLPLVEVEKLLSSKYHECRLTGFMTLVEKFKNADENEKTEIYDLYIKNAKNANNWDLVDTSAHYIVGKYLFDKDKSILFKFARSENLWERRIAMMSCFYFIQKGQSDTALEIIDILKYDSHDLIQKAVGWMLREIGKRCDKKTLVDWLQKDSQYKILPRTELRYAIEHFDQSERKKYLNGEV